MKNKDTSNFMHFFNIHKKLSILYFNLLLVNHMSCYIMLVLFMSHQTIIVEKSFITKLTLDQFF